MFLLTDLPFEVGDDGPGAGHFLVRATNVQRGSLPHEFSQPDQVKRLLPGLQGAFGQFQFGIQFL